MRKLLPALATALILILCFFVGAQPQPQTVKVRLRLIDAGTGKSVAGIIRVFGTDQKPIELPGLFDRMAGMNKDLPGVHWHVIPAAGAETTLPRGQLQVHALSGLETALAKQDLDLRTGAPEEAVIKLPFLFRPADLGLAAGNTHLHLRGFTFEKADEYLRQIPAADGLRVMFISYLERDMDDLTYITNKYPIGDLPKLSATGVLFSNGEEHRHNLKAYGEGYGHVMFLNIKDLVKPVSLGPGITGGGFDDQPLRTGIDNAKRQGGTIIWCHNNFGHEDVLSALTGRLDALNIFDGSRGGKYEDAYYRYLNIGMRMPISTGTDWFMYDMSRVYAEVPGKLTVASWLDALKAGRCQATNGPLLSLKIDGHTLGDVLDLKEPKMVKIEASAVGRIPLQKLQLIQNGRVIKTQLPGDKEPGRIKMTHEVRLEEPAWFAVRAESETKNEFEKTIFAHSSPIYVTHKGRNVFDVDEALALVKQVEEGQAAIQAKGQFSNAEASRKLLALYDDAVKTLRERINQRR